MGSAVIQYDFFSFLGSDAASPYPRKFDTKIFEALITYETHNNESTSADAAASAGAESVQLFFLFARLSAEKQQKKSRKENDH